MYFTREEKAAIVHLALAIQLADDDANKTETMLNSLVFARIGVSKEDLDYSRRMSLKEAVDVVSQMTDSEKKFVAAFFGTIVLADGNVDTAELKLWQFICTFAECPTMSLADSAKIFAEYFE